MDCKRRANIRKLNIERYTLAAKAPEIDRLLTIMTGVERTEAIRGAACVICKGFVDDDGFRNALSEREFEISGMCQGCQDDISGP